jgi:type VI secretion system secreted protein VgrG
MPLITLSCEAIGLESCPLSFDVQEQLSACPSYLLKLQDRSGALDPENLLGQAVVVKVQTPSGSGRLYHAYVTGVEDGGVRGGHAVHAITLHGWPWFMAQNANARIFQDVSAIEVIEQVFAGYDVAKFRMEVDVAPPVRSYCVQYLESDFAFVSRLLEDEGLFYRFEHDGQGHTMVITDRQAFPPLATPWTQLDYLADDGGHHGHREGIEALWRTRTITTQQVVVGDFDYLNPSRVLRSEASLQAKQAQRCEWFEYAAGHADDARGEDLARFRLEASRARGRTLRGQANLACLSAGSSFALGRHPDPTRNRSYKLLSVGQHYVQDAPDSAGEGSQVSVSFVALEDDLAFRAPRDTPRPHVPGMHSATVVGPPGAEIHTDRHSRVRVHFHWDRHHRPGEEACSCWIRVAQTWAGKGWGMLALPRVGQEVLVSYLDGDIDRPVVTGAVYNGDNPPPYDLPAEAGLTGIVTRSTQEGMPQHASQLTFDDRRGREQVKLHAERDMATSVERNQSNRIGQDRNTKVVGTDTKATNTSITYTEFSNRATGVSVARTGSSVSFTGTGLSVTGHQATMMGFLSTTYGMQTAVTGVQLSTTGARTSFTGTSVSVTGTNHSMTGFSMSYTGVSMSQTGHTIKKSGSKSSTSGSEAKTVGMQSKN